MQVRCLTFAFSQRHLLLVFGKRVAVKEGAPGRINLAVVPWQADVPRLRTISRYLCFNNTTLARFTVMMIRPAMRYWQLLSTCMLLSARHGTAQHHIETKQVTGWLVSECQNKYGAAIQ